MGGEWVWCPDITPCCVLPSFQDTGGAQGQGEWREGWGGVGDRVSGVRGGGQGEWREGWGQDEWREGGVGWGTG